MPCHVTNTKVRFNHMPDQCKVLKAQMHCMTRRLASSSWRNCLQVHSADLSSCELAHLCTRERARRIALTIENPSTAALCSMMTSAALNGHRRNSSMQRFSWLQRPCARSGLKGKNETSDLFEIKSPASYMGRNRLWMTLVGRHRRCPKQF